MIHKIKRIQFFKLSFHFVSCHQEKSIWTFEIEWMWIKKWNRRTRSSSSILTWLWFVTIQSHTSSSLLFLLNLIESSSFFVNPSMEFFINYICSTLYSLVPIRRSSIFRFYFPPRKILFQCYLFIIMLFKSFLIWIIFFDFLLNYFYWFFLSRAYSNPDALPYHVSSSHLSNNQLHPSFVTVWFSKYFWFFRYSSALWWSCITWPVFCWPAMVVWYVSPRCDGSKCQSFH